MIDRVSSNFPQQLEKKDVISEPPLKKLKTHNKFIPLNKTGLKSLLFTLNK